MSSSETQSIRRMYELSYEMLHIIAGAVYVVIGGLVSFYALKTLRVLYKNPEMLKTQRKMWLPLLIGAIFFTIGGIFHLIDHLFYPRPEIDLLYDIAILIGFSFFAVGTLQYSRFQIDYHKIKWETIRKTQTE